MRRAPRTSQTEKGTMSCYEKRSQNNSTRKKRSENNLNRKKDDELSWEE
jgi:hypothetical protein